MVAKSNSGESVDRLFDTEFTFEHKGTRYEPGY